MKFYGHGLVWNPLTDKALCRFVKGELETEEKEIQDRLIELGYEHDAESICEPKIEPYTEETEANDGYVIPDYTDAELEAVYDLEELPIEALKEMAKDKGIKGYATSKRETLISKLKEA